MKFVIDENLGGNLARGLREFGECVSHVIEEFGKGKSDTDILKTIGENEWFLITRDDAIVKNKNPHEREALKRNNVGAFLLGGQEDGRCVLITRLVKNWAQIKKHAAKERRPFALRVPRAGSKFKPVPLD